MLSPELEAQSLALRQAFAAGRFLADPIQSANPIQSQESSVTSSTRACLVADNSSSTGYDGTVG
jgi:hypothetical protein